MIIKTISGGDMKLLSIVAIAFNFMVAVQVAAEELPSEAQRMLVDLGSPEVQQSNNGKLFTCLYGGTKKVTVSFLEGSTVFGGEYSNCREKGLSRDGYYEVIVRGWELIGQSYKRSVNGELFDAATKGDAGSVRKQIKKKADVNYAESIHTTDGDEIRGWTPLMSASMNGSLEMAKLLVQSGAWVNYMNSNAVNALWLASGSGKPEVVRYLIANHAYVNNSNKDDVTPLMISSMGGHTDVVKALVDAKAAVNLVQKDGDSALMIALANGHSPVAELLIKSGADLNIQNRFGVTALIIAAAEGNEELVNYLLSHQPDAAKKTENGQTALDIALAKGNAKIIEALKRVQKPL
jgi:ankyrin repeat protein